MPTAQGICGNVPEALVRVPTWARVKRLRDDVPPGAGGTRMSRLARRIHQDAFLADASTGLRLFRSWPT